MRARAIRKPVAAALSMLFVGCASPQAKPLSQPSMATSAPMVATSAPAGGPIEPDVPRAEDAAAEAALTAEATSLFDDGFANSAGLVTPDGKTLVFRSNRDGIATLYVADAAKPDGPARRLVDTTERIADVYLTSDGKHVVYRSDKGGDENWSIFEVGIDGKGLVELTPGDPLHRDYLMMPTGVPDTVFYSARASKTPGPTVYSLALRAGAAPIARYTDAAAGELFDVSPDGTRGLLRRTRSSSDASLVVIDFASGNANEIYPRKGKTERVSQANFSPDGRAVYLTTDGGGEGSIMLAIDAKTGAERARYEETSPPTGRIDDFWLSRDGKYVAAVVDAGNHAQMRILDQKTLKPGAPVSMPLGTGGGPRFSDDGTLVVAWSTPTSPQDLYAIDPKNGAVRPLRRDARASLASLSPIDASLAELTSFDGTKVPLNLYLPAGFAASPPKKLPVIVYMHGGPASSAAIRWSTWFRFYVSHGFAVVEPNVRGSTGFGRAFEQADDGPKRLDAVKDLGAVADWVGKQRVGRRGSPRRDGRELRRLHGAHGCRHATENVARGRRSLRRLRLEHDDESDERATPRLLPDGDRPRFGSGVSRIHFGVGARGGHRRAALRLCGCQRSARSSVGVRPNRRVAPRARCAGRVHGCSERRPLDRSEGDRDRLSRAERAVPREGVRALSLRVRVRRSRRERARRAPELGRGDRATKGATEAARAVGTDPSREDLRCPRRRSPEAPSPHRRTGRPSRRSPS